MELKKYFDEKKGIGVLATADKDGKVDAAVYARPHVFEDGSVAFITNDRLTRRNLQSNPHAAFLFIEQGGESEGKRLFLTKFQEEAGGKLLEELVKNTRCTAEDYGEGPKFLVYFKVEKVLPLIGSGEKKKTSACGAGCCPR
ncbi:MAG: pyridoxamine 5'-phosphate oxidase family protein [Elusimicrobiota bacterium]